MAVVSPELVLRWAASAGVLVTGAGFATALAPAVPPALIWGAAFVVFVVFAAALWRRRLDDLEVQRHRVDHRPDRPYQPSAGDDPQY
jgi:membrane protein implicated in regulation of membrane protease activity